MANGELFEGHSLLRASRLSAASSHSSQEPHRRYRPAGNFLEAVEHFSLPLGESGRDEHKHDQECWEPATTFSPGTVSRLFAKV